MKGWGTRWERWRLEQGRRTAFQCWVSKVSWGKGQEEGLSGSLGEKGNHELEAGPHHSRRLVGEKSQDHQQLGRVQDERRMDVRAPEKQTNLWSREKCRGWVLEGPFSPKETKMTREKSLTYLSQRNH